MDGHRERTEGGLLFSTDPKRLDIARIHAFLAGESYWVPGIPRDIVERAIANSLCFGVYEAGQQLAFARVITDGAGFAWLADVFVVAERRGEGVGRSLIRFVLEHPSLVRTRRFMLATRDAHGLYREFGFTALSHPDRIMERYDPDALSR